MFDDSRKWNGGGGVGTYILTADHLPTQVDTLTWGTWMEIERRKPVGESLWRIGHQLLPGQMRVSTIFMGLDHSFRGTVPILFETMAFDRTARLTRPDPWMKRRKHSVDLGQWRCATWDQAMEMHRKAVAAVRKYGKRIHTARMAGDRREVGRLQNRLDEAMA